MEAASTSASGPEVDAYQRYRVRWPLAPAMAMVTIADACQSAFAAGGAIMFVAFLVALALMQPGRKTATE
jgi:hypothetical protein